MNLKIELNIYRLPEVKLDAKFKVPDDWGLEKIMDFARDQLTSFNRLCCVAGAGPDGGDDIGGRMKALYEAVPVEKSGAKRPGALHMYARRAGHMKYHEHAWCQWLMARMWAFNNRFSKCLGGE